MIINIKMKDELIVGYRTYPIDLNKDYAEVSEIPTDILTGGYTCINHKLCKKGVVTPTRCDEVKYEKEILIKAFEKYKSDVFYGLLKEDEDQHEKILSWYKNLQANLPESLRIVPAEILCYLEV